MLFTDLMNSMLCTNEQSWSVKIPDGWMQGRTTYGGLSAALCLQAINNDYPDLPPLRSAQINFVGPADENATVSTKVLRSGKSVSFINAEIIGSKGLATQAVFCFGASRESQFNQNFITASSVPNPNECVDLFSLGEGPAFTNNFECLHAAGSLPLSKAESPEFHLWVRHKDQTANNLPALLSIADMAPPAILSSFTELAPVSSMTWMMNFVSNSPQTTDGWWLLNSSADHARDGYSSQNMNIWNSDGELVIAGRQNIAFFC